MNADHSHDDARLRDLVRRLPDPDEHRDWGRIEQAVLDQLHGDAGRPRVWRWAGLPLRAAAAITLMALLVLGVTWVATREPTGQPAVAMTRLTIEGAVQVCMDSCRIAPVAAGVQPEGGWESLNASTELQPGMSLRTGPDAFVGLRIDSGSGFALGERSQVQVFAATPSVQDYALHHGAIRVQLARRHRQQWLTVRTGNAECRALGTVYTVTAETRNEVDITTVSVVEGTVLVQSSANPEVFRTVKAPDAVRLVGQRFESVTPLIEPVPEAAADDREEIPRPAPPEPIEPPAVDLPVAAPPQLPPAPPAVVVAWPDSPVAEPVEEVLDTPQVAVDSGRDSLKWPVHDMHPRRVVDSAYVAGSLLGRPLFWRYDLAPHDTLGLAQVLAPFEVAVPRGSSAQAVAAALAEGGMRLYRLREATAIAVALLQRIGYRTLMMTQWSSTVKGNWPGDHRTYIQDEGIFSDWLWESVSVAEIQRAPLVRGGGFDVCLHFREGGASSWHGQSTVDLRRRAVITPHGVVLRKTGRPYVAGNPYRLVTATYVIVPDAMGVDDIARELERAMDRLGLDITYRTPELSAVAMGGRR